MPHGVIYGLHDPETGELRYIGQTITSVPQRLAAHVAPSSLPRHSYLARWLLGLVKRGLSPTWTVRAEAGDQADLDRLEKEHITIARAEGARLVNLSDGGGGRAGYVTHEETRHKIAESQRGVPKPKHTEEWKQRMSRLKSGCCTNTPEHMARLAEMKRGIPRSEETKARISASRTGQPSHMSGKHHSEASKTKISESRRGKMVGAEHHQFRSDISTMAIVELVLSGRSKVDIAADLNVSPTFIHRRLNQARAAGIFVPRKRAG